MIYDIESMGQVFTPDWIGEKMLALRENYGSVLEPSAGQGVFFNHPCQTRVLNPHRIAVGLALRSSSIRLCDSI